VLAYIVGICGVVMLVCGIGVYAAASAELSTQHITVASYNEGSDGTLNGPEAGKPMAGPFTALSQIYDISHHLQQASQTATGGQKDSTTGVVTGGDPNVTYGTAPSITLDSQGNCTNAVAQWTDPAGMGTVQCDKGGPLQTTGSINGQAIAGLRSTQTTGSFLISSLFVSVLAFGVSTVVAAVGVLFLLMAIVALRLMGKSRRDGDKADAAQA